MSEQANILWGSDRSWSNPNDLSEEPDILELADEGSGIERRPCQPLVLSDEQLLQISTAYGEESLGSDIAAKLG